MFLPVEMPALMGVDMAREGLARLAGSPPGMTSAGAREAVAGVGLLESTLYLRNQLLRDSDWAGMGHSLELRTPLVDAQLLATLGPCTAGFKGRAGKAMLAHAPEKSLPATVVNRPKAGFSLPMAAWLSKATDQRPWSDLSLLAPAGTPWARRWSRIVVERSLACE
jgi:asparagine synthase (glutamine-hydrolysing)